MQFKYTPFEPDKHGWSLLEYCVAGCLFASQVSAGILIFVLGYVAGVAQPRSSRKNCLFVDKNPSAAADGWVAIAQIGLPFHAVHAGVDFRCSLRGLMACRLLKPAKAARARRSSACEWSASHECLYGPVFAWK